MLNAAFHTARTGKIQLDWCQVYTPTECSVEIQLICALDTVTLDYSVLWQSRKKCPDKGTLGV